MSKEEITGGVCDFREKGSRYMFCGKETPIDSKFCQHCGKKLIVKQTMKYKQEVKEKIFDFDGFSSNHKNVEQVNDWLWGQSIMIKEIAIHTFMSFKWETVPSRIRFRYIEIPSSPFVFQLGYFSKMSLFSMSYEELDRQLETWKYQNSNHNIVYTKRTGHQTNRGNTKSLYYLYMMKACPKCRTPIQNENICPNCGNTIS